MNKPFKGTIRDYTWHTFPTGERCVRGLFVDHPEFAGKRGHTSLVVDIQPTNDPYVDIIETLNSRYRLEWTDELAFKNH